MPELPLPNGARSRIAAIFAHPDDESYFAGATLADYARAGCEVRLATLTGGEVFGPIRLRQYALAGAALGASDSQLLRPGTWQDLGNSGAAGSLSAAPLAELSDAIAEFAAEVSPDLMIINDADGVTGHPDHLRVHEAALAARGSVPVVLAGCVRAADVEAATLRLGELAPGAKIGSGGIRGVPADAELVEVAPSSSARRSRAAALDVYHPGLGTSALEELTDPGAGVHDGVVLRAIAEAAAHREFFRRL
ncbi:PIG-L deacetylase family protein [Microlunatus sp. GCM10028923]|uniref:PIG-L deacetylase family protein n=1 Tax=Microlunatus sp. GCM10028923 TaxID=3273400 RepID=UPI00360AE149